MRMRHVRLVRQHVMLARQQAPPVWRVGVARATRLAAVGFQWKPHISEQFRRRPCTACGISIFSRPQIAVRAICSVKAPSKEATQKVWAQSAHWSCLGSVSKSRAWHEGESSNRQYRSYSLSTIPRRIAIIFRRCLLHCSSNPATPFVISKYRS